MDKNNITEKAQEWRETAEDLKEQAQNWKEQARTWKERAREKAVDAGRATDQYIHDNAWSSVGVAVVAGLLLGILLGRIRD